MRIAHAWGHALQWRILATHWAQGHAFFATWQAWLTDPAAPSRLHYCVAVSATDVPLRRGFYRIPLHDGRLLLTLCVGDDGQTLGEWAFSADTVLFTGDCPGLSAVKAIARRCRIAQNGVLATRFTIAKEAIVSLDDLRQCGFVFDEASTDQGIFAPHWPLKPPQKPTTLPSLRHCVVIGAGLAGAAVAHSLARRGWAVRVLDAADRPAAGASAVPAGLLAPQVTPDDNVSARLSRAGGRFTWQAAKQLLKEGADWQLTGSLEHLAERHGEAQPPLWHAQAGWIKPAALVAALLDHPNIVFQGNSRVAALRCTDGIWSMLSDQAAVVAQAPWVVMATAFASESLLNPLLTRPLPLQAVRGQVTWGTAPLGYPSSLPTYPVHGHGSLIPRIGTAGDSDDSAPRWVLGSTYERDVADLPPTADQVALANEANLARLGKLLPDFAALATLATPPPHHAFVGIRCSTRDRLPVLGQIASHPGLWISSGMGSRGLTFAVLCAELLAAQWHGEPWPIERTLAEKLDPVRLFKTSQPHDG